MKVSVIVPIYNTELYIKQCIDSIINQTYKDIEIILIDDGSSDNSPAICDYYANIDKRIIIIHKKNEGVNVARRVGLSIASSDYILFVDADDWLEVNMCQIMYDTIIIEKADIAICNAFFSYKDHKEEYINKFKGAYNKQEIRTKILPNFISIFTNEGLLPSLWNKLFKKDLFIKNDSYYQNNIFIGEDLIMTYSNVLIAEKIVFIDKALYNYRQNETQVTKKFSDKLYDNYIDVYSKLKLMNEEISPIDISLQINRLFIIWMRNSIINLVRMNKNYKTIKKLISDIVINNDIQEAVENCLANIVTFKERVLCILIKRKSRFFIFLLIKLFCMIK